MGAVHGSASIQPRSHLTDSVNISDHLCCVSTLLCTEFFRQKESICLGSQSLIHTEVRVSAWGCLMYVHLCGHDVHSVCVL